MRKPIKRAALLGLKTAGVQSLLANSQWRQGRLAILCYHGISIEDEHECDPRFYMDVGRFERRMQLLRNGGFTILPLGEAVSRLYAGKLPPRSVAITFDDGCFDFYNRAFPILEKYQLPATVYLTTWYCFHPRPVFPYCLYYLLWKGRDILQKERLLGLECPVDLHTENGRGALVAAIVADCERRNLSIDAKDELAVRLAEELGLDYQMIVAKRLIQLMKPEEVSILARKGVDVQLHTHRHRTPRDEALFIREIEDNRRHIQEMTGTDAVHFCYPSGVYYPEFFPWLRGQRVISATSCVSGLATPQMDPLLLPRIVDTCQLSVDEFEAALIGVTTGLW